MRLRNALVAGAMFATLTACGGTTGSTTDEAPAGSNADVETSDAPTEEPQEEADPKFGETYSYEDGLSVTVSEPKDFKPSEYAAADDAAAYQVFEITVVNKTGKKFDPALIYATVQSGNEEASSVYDSETIGDSPSTTLLDGREVKFKLAFGVKDPSDLVMEISPDAGIEYQSIIYTS